MRSGDRVRLRPVLPSDRDGIAAAYGRLSRESKRMRFFVPLAELTPEMLSELSEVDHFDRAAWLAQVEQDGRWTGIGIARYIRDPQRPETAEAAVTVIDSFQGHGIGTVLLEILTFAALDHGISTFVGQVLRDNDRMLSVLRHAHAHFEFDEPGVLRFEIDLPQKMLDEISCMSIAAHQALGCRDFSRELLMILDSAVPSGPGAPSSSAPACSSSRICPRPGWTPR